MNPTVVVCKSIMMMDTQLDDYISSQQPDDMHFLTPRMQGSQSNNNFSSNDYDYEGIPVKILAKIHTKSPRQDSLQDPSLQ